MNIEDRTMDVSVIIVSYNTAALLRDCLRSVHRHTSDIHYEIIVVDNDSRDGSPEMVIKEFPEVILLKNMANEGFGKANNAGYKLTNGKYVLFLNSDTLLIGNAIKEFYDFMERPENQDVYACGGKLLQNDLIPTKSYGNFPSVLEIMLYAVRIDRLLPSIVKDKISTGAIPEYSIPFNVDYIVGADMFVRKSAVYPELPFDEDFFLYFEETELCHRLKQRGFRAVIIPDISIVHLEGRSSSETNYNIYARSQILYLKKCHSACTAAVVKNYFMIIFIIRFFMTFDKKYIQKYLFYRGLSLR
jgi:GT2 family glycosyltransferase